MKAYATVKAYAKGGKGLRYGRGNGGEVLKAYATAEETGRDGEGYSSPHWV